VIYLIYIPISPRPVLVLYFLDYPISAFHKSGHSLQSFKRVETGERTKLRLYRPAVSRRLDISTPKATDEINLESTIDTNTMPFNELPSKGDSWPPTLLRLSSDPTSTSTPTPAITISAPSPSPSSPIDASDASNAIDENPFSFFLTRPDNEFDLDDEDGEEDPDEFFYHDAEPYVYSDLDDDEDLSAGIETPDSDNGTAVREISPSSLQRAMKDLDLGNELSKDTDVFADDDEDTIFGIAMPLSLRDFSRRFSDPQMDGRQSRIEIARAGVKKEEMGRGLDISRFKKREQEELTIRRGRPMVRIVPVRNGRGRGQTRSLSVRKPPSWKVPGRDIWSIKEESDEEKKSGEIVSTSAPTRTGILIPPGSPRSRSQKRVHWAV
jgi:hypothetical protein